MRVISNALCKGLIPAVALLCAAGAAAQQSVDESLVPLQGGWTVTAAEQGGRPFDAIKGGVLDVDGEVFDLVTASGNEIGGVLRVEVDAQPQQIDFLLSDGVVWEGIFTVRGDILRMNYVERGDAERPTIFATTSDTPGTVIVLRRTAAAD